MLANQEHFVPLLPSVTGYHHELTYDLANDVYETHPIIVMRKRSWVQTQLDSEVTFRSGETTFWTAPEGQMNSSPQKSKFGSGAN